MVDTRLLGVEDWTQLKDESTAEQHTADLQFVEAVIEALPTDFFESASPTPTVTESNLEEELSKLMPKIQEILKAKSDRGRPTLTTQPRKLEARQLNEKAVSKTETAVSDLEKEIQKGDQKEPTLTKEDPSTSNSSPEPTKVVVPRVSSRHAKLFNEALSASGISKTEKKELALILNVLDFAGQKEYRPMHHCFITRRAVYLVVFNTQHILIYLDSKQSACGSMMINPFEDIRYWLQSIYVHTRPAIADKDATSQEAPKNVCLIGTHRSPRDKSKGKPIRMAKLQEINTLIREELEDDDRCLTHIHFMKGPDGASDWIFLPVENSMEDRDKSGAKAIRTEINEATHKLSFIREEYPVVWMQFDSELARLKESLKGKNVFLVKVEKLLKIAEQCEITGFDQQMLALEFYHDSGKIVYLKFLPKLFITKEEHDELQELVLLDPKSLFDIMKNVMELDYGSAIIGPLVRDLNNTGIASDALLKKAWSDYLQEPIEKSFRQICLILQAEALIYPIRSFPKTLSPTMEQSPSKNEEAPTTKYLIPGKLPEKNKKQPAKSSRWITFYFDFQKFLPAEIYHRLVCLMLAVVQSKKCFGEPYDLSQNMCLFEDIDNCDWCVEMDSGNQRLKFSVLQRKSDTRNPTCHIKTIHTEYLRRICEMSDLQGIRYFGGPLLDSCAECGESHLIIQYVRYYEGHELKSMSECPKCHETYDIKQLLIIVNQEKDQQETIGRPLPSTQAQDSHQLDFTNEIPNQARNFQPCTNVKDKDFSATTRWELDKVHPILNGSGITIAIIDTGIHLGHQAFREKHSKEPITGDSFVDGSQWAYSRDSHGLMAAYVATGRKFPACVNFPGAQSQQLIDIPNGVAPGAKLSVSYVGTDYSPTSILSALENLHKLNKKSIAENEGKLFVDIISMSFGMEYDSLKDSELSKIIRDLTGQGVICVAAAGNDGGYQSGSLFPANDANVISVGALDTNARVADFNPTNSGTVDVYAPGEQIPSPVGKKNEVQYFNGTSCAAPAIAGLIALMLQFDQEKQDLLAGTPGVKELLETQFRDLNYLKNIVLKKDMIRGDNRYLLHPREYFFEKCRLHADSRTKKN